MNDISDPLIFNVYKPVDLSSFKLVSHFKRNLDFPYGKIGHFGTLDPFADGVLLIGISGAQRMNDYIHKYYPKVYRAKGFFGQKKDSGDLTGLDLEKKDISLHFQKMSKKELESFLLQKFQGKYWQSPHAFSAAKHQGKKLYEYALKGELVVKEQKERFIHSFEILNFEYPHIEFTVSVSSGTYIRSLFEEMSEHLLGVGHLISLTRIQIGPFKLEDSLLSEQLPKKGESESYFRFGKKIDESFILDQIVLNEFDTKKFIQGQLLNAESITRLACREAATDELVWVKHTDGMLLGLGEIQNGHLKTKFNLQKSVEFFTQHFKTL